MSAFTTELKVLYVDGKHWILLSPFTYRVGSVDSDEIIFVPAAFKTDFASIPRLLWPAMGHPTGKHGKAAVVHDWLYQYPEEYSRRRCDQIFLEAMRVLGVGWWKRSAMYAGVRIGGWVGWNRYRKADRKREGSDAGEVMG